MDLAVYLRAPSWVSGLPRSPVGTQPVRWMTWVPVPPSSSLRKEGGLSRSQLLRGFSEIIVLWTLPGLGERLFRRELYLVVNSISACCFQAVCSQVSLQWPPHRNQSSTEAVNLKAQPFTPPPSRAGEPLFSEQQTPTRPAG